MVTVLPPKFNIGSQIGQALGQGLHSGISTALSEHLNKQKEQRDLQNYFQKLIGQEQVQEQFAPGKLQQEISRLKALENLENQFAPGRLEQELTKREQLQKLENQFVPEKLQQELNRLQALEGLENKFAPERLEREVKKAEALKQVELKFDANEKNYGAIKDAFGEKFANIWKASPTGARTELTKAALESNLRGYDIENLLSNISSPKSTQSSTNMENGEFPQYILNTEGKTPKEVETYKRELRQENLPRYQEAQKRSRSIQKEQDSLNILNNLNESGKLPENAWELAANLINPLTGKAIIPATLNPETQRFIKTINDFTTKAKDSYGSRVTNFDLQQFMQRLPGLANSAEGRKQIIRQMQISNALDSLYENALKKVYKHYGVGNITQEDADDMSQNMIEDQEKLLKAEYDQISESLDGKSVNNSEGYVLMHDLNGTPLYVPSQDVDRVKQILQEMGRK